VPSPFQRRGHLCFLSERNQLLSYRVQNCFHAIPGAHLPHDVGYVTRYCVVANTQFARHLLVAVSGRD